MRFACGRTTDQDDILSRVHELTTMQLVDQGFVDLAGGEGEAREILISREACGFHIKGDQADFTFGHLSFEQLREYRDSIIKRRCSLLNQIADRISTISRSPPGLRSIRL